MFFRYFVVLALIALSAVAIRAEEQKVVDISNVDVDEISVRANPAVKAVMKLFGGLFASAAAGCALEAGNKCKSHWKNPKKAYECGKNFLKQNKGRCAAGK